MTLVAALASTIFMPLEAWLLTWLGWRTALATLALILGLITIPIHALVLRPSPDPVLSTRGYSPALAASMIGWMGAM